jgi:dTDP-glucose pyrophosphorylase
MITDYRKSIVSQEATIQEAISCLNTGNSRIALVTDDESTLKGVITDSDIRRAVLDHISLESPLSNIMKKEPIVVYSWQTDSEILNLMQEHYIYQIPVLDNLNKVIGLKAINDLLSIKQPQINNSVILMAGGLGKRLYPITKDVPKPLVPVNGKPILRIILDNLQDKGFSDIKVSINHKGEMIRNALKRHLRYKKVTFLEENIRLGTAGALSLLEEKPIQPFLVQNADILTTLDYTNMLTFHSENKNAITMAVRREKISIPYGVVEIDNSKVSSIREKPDHFYFANVGIYIISPEVLNKIPSNEYYDMTTLIEDCLKDNIKVGSFPMHEYWADIGQPDELERAHQDSKLFFN